MPSPVHYLTAIAIAISSHILPARAASSSTYLDHARNATDLLTQQWYNETSGQFDNYWWQTASMLNTWADLTSLDDQLAAQAHHYFETTYQHAPASNGGAWLNDYYDDEGWWALAWIKIYDMTKDQKYLITAQAVFYDMATGLGSLCGGQWWSKDKTYTATISNQLFFATASALANRTPNSGGYKTFASASLQWLQGSGLVTANSTFWDGKDAIRGCALVGPAWTYNQGVILGGLVEYHALTNDKTVLDFAHQIAHGAIAHLTDNDGILTEDGYPNSLDVDRAMFKGIFVRNLAYLHAVSPSSDYVTFIQHNADTIWLKGRAENGMVGPNWQGPLQTPIGVTQAAAADCLIAAASITRQSEQASRRRDGRLIPKAVKW